jgi:hypothetical protein
MAAASAVTSRESLKVRDVWVPRHVTSTTPPITPHLQRQPQCNATLHDPPDAPTQTKRQHLYSTIATALQQQQQQQQQPGLQPGHLLDQLQAVLEAEACLSCCDGDGSSTETAPHHNPPAAPATQVAAAAPSPNRQLARPPAACTVQQLKEELAQRVHESVVQAQLQPEAPGRKTKVREQRLSLADCVCMPPFNASALPPRTHSS